MLRKYIFIALMAMFVMGMSVQAMAAETTSNWPLTCGTQTSAYLQSEIMGTTASNTAAFKDNTAYETSNWPLTCGTQTSAYFKEEVVGSPEATTTAFTHNPVHETSNWPVTWGHDADSYAPEVK